MNRRQLVTRFVLATVAASVSIAGIAGADPLDALGGAARADKPAVRVSPPPPRPVPPEGSEFCPAPGHSAVIDRDAQRAWLCTDGIASEKFPITTAITQPDPGTYKVYAKDRLTTSTFGGHFSYLDNFVAFARGKYSGARVAFHAVPRRADGTPYEPYDAVGTPEWHGDSSGCIRVLPDQSVVIWNHLAVGDAVRVIT